MKMTGFPKCESKMMEAPLLESLILNDEEKYQFHQPV